MNVLNTLITLAKWIDIANLRLCRPPTWHTKGDFDHVTSNLQT